MLAPAATAPARILSRRLAEACALAGCLAAVVSAQVITVDTRTGMATAGGSAPVDRRYAQVEPTHVDLPKEPLDPKTRLELIRFLEADEGFAMRPFPRGHQGLVLEANGKLTPAGDAYVDMVTKTGISAKPGDRLTISDVRIDRTHIEFMLNGGPDPKHRFLRHIQIGVGVDSSPVMQDDGQEPTGARLVLSFHDQVPELTGKQVEALLVPLISFEVKTPIQAFTDTLPPQLKSAILDHHVLVGMSTDMVLFSMGKPDSKVREMDGQMPFEEWIYGQSPKDVTFVRVNGNRVIRVEVAKMGKPPEIFTHDEVEGLMRTDGSPVTAAAGAAEPSPKFGDVERNPDTQAVAPPPSMRNPGETLPQDDPRNPQGAMRPVQFPKQAPDDAPVAHRPAGTAAPPGDAAPQVAPADHSDSTQ